MFDIDLTYLQNDFISLLVAFATSIVVALIVLVIGLFLIQWIVRLVDTLMQRRNFDVSLRPFLRNIMSIALKVVLIIMVIDIVGIETTSLIAVIGAAGLAIGLALQGSLANFAGGVLILAVKPFRVGDFIEAAGKSGIVQEIKILNTIIKTPHNQVVFIPNGKLASDVITNYTMEENRRLDLVFGIGYDDDLLKAKNILQEIVASEVRILKDPVPVIAVDELADSSVNFILKIWCSGTEYWNLRHELVERVKLEFDKQDITIPFPQRDVHIKQQ